MVPTVTHKQGEDAFIVLTCASHIDCIPSERSRANKKKSKHKCGRHEKNHMVTDERKRL